MAYEKTNWNTGDIITAEKLNKLENGVEGFNLTPLSVEITAGESGPDGIDKSYNELYEAITAGRSIVIGVTVPDMGDVKESVTCSLVTGEKDGTTMYIAGFLSSSILSDAAFVATDPDEPMVIQG